MSFDEEDSYLWKRKDSDPAVRAGEKIKEFEQLKNRRLSKYEKFGLCRKCRHFQAVTKLYGAYSQIRGYCSMLPDSLVGSITEQQPVVDCMAYWPIGAPTLNEMLAQAKMLEKRDGVKGYL